MILKWERITRGDNTDYLWRLHIFTCKWFRIYFHIFVASDDECLHDHPWDYVSFILWNGYWEVTPQGKRWYGAGRVLRRPATWKHQVIVDKPAITLVFTSGKQRSWGFWTKLGQWIHWSKYDQKVHCAP